MSALLVTAPASARDPVAEAWRRAELEARRWLAIAGSEPLIVDREPEQRKRGRRR